MAPCYHTKSSCETYAPAPAWVKTSQWETYSYVSSTELIAAGNCHCNYPSGICHSINWPRPITDCMLESALSAVSPASSYFFDHWEKCKPTLETRASLGVFLGELRDISRMFSILPSKHLGKIRSWKDLSEWIHYGNAQHLNYNFGIRPFVSDVQRSLRAIDNYEKRLYWYLYHANSQVHRRWIDELPTVTNDYILATPYTTLWRHIVNHTYTEKFASNFWYEYDSPYSNVQGGPSCWRTWADTLGLNVNPSTIWALLPWSFVVDWFYDVEGLLKSGESDWMQTWIRLLQGCYSRKRSGTLTWAIKSPDAYGGVTLPGITLKYSLYSRNLGFPSFSSETNLDADKIRLGASLAYSRFR